MTTPKGGRGKKADYRTIQVRCPEPLKFTVHELIRRYHAQEFTPQPIPKAPAAMSDEELLAMMAELGKEYSQRIPKSTEQLADELVDRIIGEWDETEIPQSVRLQVVARITEEILK